MSRKSAKPGNMQKICNAARIFALYVVLVFLLAMQGIEAAFEENCPVTISNYSTGRKPVTLCFDKKTSRVIACHQNNIEILRAFHEEGRLIATQGRYVAVSEEDKEEKARILAQIPYYGFYGIDQETAVYLRPDLILGWPSSFTRRGVWSLGTTDFWKSRRVNCYMSGHWENGVLVEKLSDECQYILDIGEIFGRNREAEYFVNDICKYIKNIRVKALTRKKQRIVILDYFNSHITSYGRDRLCGDMASCLGADLVEISAHPSKEEILMANPDVVFLIYKDESEKDVREVFLADRIYDSMVAVHTGRVYSLPITYVYNPGLRAKDALRLMASALYSE